MEKLASPPFISMPDRHLFILFAVTIAWMPLPAGSNWPWAWVVLQMMILTIAIGWILLYTKGQVALTNPLIQAQPVIIMLGIWSLWIIVQLLPLPISWIQLIAPHTAQLAQQAAEIVTLPITTTTISVDPHLTFQKLMQTLALVIFFVLALLLLNTRTRIKWILWLIVYSALFQAVFGSLMTLSGIEYHLFGAKEHNIGVATGTFINRNHLAGYLEMALAIGIGLLLSQMRSKTYQSWRQKLRDWIGVILEKKMQLRLILAILVIGLVMTHSRMGNSAFFSSLLISGFIWIFLSGRRPKRTTIYLFVSLILIDLYIVGTWFGFEKVVERLEGTSVVTETRYEVVKSLMKAIPDYGVSGSGLGTFKTVYPSYKDSQLMSSYLYAHNDYLQFVLEGGGAVLLLAVVVMASVLTAYRAMRTRRDPLYRGIGFASLMGVVAILIHSMVDFNLQIPANAIMFMLLLALAWIGCYGEKSRRLTTKVALKPASNTQTKASRIVEEVN